MELKTKQIIRLSIRIPDATNPDHHIWNNNGQYWLHMTVHYADRTAERIRKPLKTGDIAEARRRRDLELSRIYPYWQQTCKY